MKKPVAGAQPAERRQPPVPFGADPLPDRLQIIDDGQNAIVAGQSVDLRPKGHEGDEIDDPQQPQKQPAGEITVSPVTFELEANVS